MDGFLSKPVTYVWSVIEDEVFRFTNNPDGGMRIDKLDSSGDFVPSGDWLGPGGAGKALFEGSELSLAEVERRIAELRKARSTQRF